MTLHQTNQAEYERVRQGDIYSNVPTMSLIKNWMGSLSYQYMNFLMC
jgi:hypothetical protein